MIALIRNRDYYGLSLSLLIIISTIAQKYTALAIALFVIVFIVDLIVSKKYSFAGTWPHFLLMGLFLFYAAGLLWSEHVDIGIKLLEYKMSFFIFPLLFLMRKKGIDFWQIIPSFIIANFFLTVALSVYSLVNKVSVDVASMELFNIHPTYSSTYILIAGFILIIGYRQKGLSISKTSLFIVIGYWLIIVILLISFANILFLMCAVFVVIAVLLFQKKGPLIGWSFLILSPFCGYLILNNTPFLDYDVRTAKDTISEFYNEPQDFLCDNLHTDAGTKLRPILWILSVEIIQKYPFGVGLGDIDYHIEDRASFYGVTHLEDHALNPHNQFLQIAIDIGLPGMYYLIILLLLIAGIAIRRKDYILLFVVSNLIFNSLFESMLQRQSGIVFYTLIICICLTYSATSKFNSKKKLIDGEE